MEDGSALKGTYLAEKLWDWIWRRASSRMFSWWGLEVAEEAAELVDEAAVMVGKEMRWWRIWGLGLSWGFWKREDGEVGWRREDAIARERKKKKREKLEV